MASAGDVDGDGLDDISLVRNDMEPVPTICW